MADDQNPDDALEPEQDALDDLAELDFDEADAGAGKAAPRGDGAVDDLDGLIDAATAPADEAPAAAGGAGPAGADALADLAGDGIGRLMEFSARLTDVLQVGLESVAGQRAGLSGAHLDPTSFDAVATSFADVPHIALRLKLAFSEHESEPLVVLVPLADAGALIRLETDADELADPDFRDRQLDAVATAVRELLDLMSLALFTDALMGAEVTLQDIRLDSGREILDGVAEDVGSAGALRLDIALDVAGGERVGFALVMAPPLITRFARALAPAPARAQAGVRLDAALPPSAPQAAPSPLVLDDAPAARAFNAGNVSPIRPAATVGRVPDDVDVHPVRFPTIGETPVTARVPRSLELLMDVEMRVSVELGRSSLSVEEILSLGPGSVVELNKLAGEPVDILVNDHLIARGEVVVVDENFGVRLTEIVSAHKRVHVMAR